MKHSVFFVPYWVVDTLQRNRLPLTTLLEISKLRTVLSGGDLAAISYLNSHLSLLLPPLKNKHMGSNGTEDAEFAYDEYFCIDEHWRSNSVGTDLSWLQTTLPVIKQQPQTEQNLKARLFDAEPKAWQPSETPEEKPFIIYDLDRTVSLVSIQAGHFKTKFGPGARQLQLELVRAVLKVLYAYMPYNTLAKTSWFRHYLCLLNPYRAG